MKKIFVTLIVLIVATFLPGCKKDISESAYNDFITKLDEKDFEVVGKDVEEDILKGERKWLTIDDSENLSVYLYERNEKMEEDASYIDEDGCSYNNGKTAYNISWISWPHFFKADNMIVLYVGENEVILNAIEEIIGVQFAGYSKVQKND